MVQTFTATHFAGVASLKAMSDGKISPEEMDDAARDAIQIAQEFNAALLELDIVDENVIATARRMLSRAILGKSGDIKAGVRFSLKAGRKLLERIQALQPVISAPPIKPEDIL